jgi:hypothetical protein
VAETNTENPLTGSARSLLRRTLPLFVLVAICSICAASLAALAHRASDATPEPSAPSQERDFATFSHSTAEHRQDCNSCHRRTDNSAAPRLPGHKACTGCHLQQFVTPQSSAMCSICHTNIESGNPPVKSITALRSFNARFDHAAHEQGAGRPEQGCASCHAPLRRGVALSIPATLNAHNNCFQCHTPQAQSGGRDIGSCGTCHDMGRLSRTSTGSRAFNVGFSHATHGPRQRLDCADCHTVRAGAPRAQQVTSPRPTQHFGSARAQNCMTCHNNRRAFGGDDFSDCKKCHKGQTFRL